MLESAYNLASFQFLDTMRGCVSLPDFYERLAIGGRRIIHAAMVSQTPLRRLGEPKEVAAAYAWLASDEALFVTAPCSPWTAGSLLERSL